MKSPLIPKPAVSVEGTRVPLRPKLSADIAPMVLLQRLVPTGVYNTNPSQAVSVYSVLSDARTLEIDRGPQAVNYHYATWYDQLFGEASSDSAPSHQAIRHRVLTYLDILGRVAREQQPSEKLLNHFIASWTGDIGKLDELGRSLWNIEKEAGTMSTNVKNPTKKESKEPRPRKSHDNLIEQIAQMTAKYEAMGPRNPIIAPMGKDGYRGRRDTKQHQIFLGMVSLAKAKNGAYIRDIYHMCQNNDVGRLLISQVSGLLAMHPELLTVEPVSGMVTYNKLDIAAINEANAPQEEPEAPKPAPKAKVAPKTATKAPTTAKPVVPKAAVAPKTAVKPKAALKPVTPKKPVAAPASA